MSVKSDSFIFGCFTLRKERDSNVGVWRYGDTSRRNERKDNVGSFHGHNDIRFS